MAEPRLFDMTVRQLMQRFPKGFSISPDGHLYEVIDAKRRPADLPRLSSPGGYIAVSAPVLRVGDEFYGIEENGMAQRLTPSELAEELDRLIALADTVAEDGILAKLYQTYSERLDYAARELLSKP